MVLPFGSVAIHNICQKLFSVDPCLLSRNQSEKKYLCVWIYVRNFSDVAVSGSLVNAVLLAVATHNSAINDTLAHSTLVAERCICCSYGTWNYYATRGQYATTQNDNRFEKFVHNCMCILVRWLQIYVFLQSLIFLDLFGKLKKCP